MKKLLIPCISLLIFCFSGLKAQQVVASGGGLYEGGSVTLSWTIGETVVETLTNGSIILTQGFQQGYLSSNSIEEYLGENLDLKVYPNPTSGNINLSFKSDDYSQLGFIIHDISGKATMDGSISSDLTEIDLGQYSDGIYLLRVVKKSGEPLKSIRIVKR